MNDNNVATPLNLAALYSEPLLKYLSTKNMGRLRQVNRELYQSSRLKNTLISRGKTWVDNSFSEWDNENIRLRSENDPNKLRVFLLKLLFKQHSQKYYSNALYSFYLFLGGEVPFELIFEKAKQERQRENSRDCAINTFTCAPRSCCYNGEYDRCCAFTGFNAVSVFFLTLPLCAPSLSCSWLMYTGIGMLGTSTGGTTLACLESKYHIFTCCCEPYAELEKLDNTRPNPQAPARVEMREDVPVLAEITAQRNSLSNRFKGLFFKPETAPTELSPLVTENKSCEGEHDYVKK